MEGSGRGETKDCNEIWGRSGPVQKCLCCSKTITKIQLLHILACLFWKLLVSFDYFWIRASYTSGKLDLYEFPLLKHCFVFFSIIFFFFPCGVWGCRSHISRCSPLAQEGGILRIRGVGNARMQHGGRKCVLWLAMKAEPWKPGSRREECPAMSHMTRDLKVMMAWTGAVLKPTQLWLICVKTKKKLSEREWQGQEEPLKCHSCPFEVWRHWHLFTLPTRGYGATARPRWHRLRLKSLAFNTIQTLTQAQQRDPLPTRHLSFVLNTNTPIRRSAHGYSGSMDRERMHKCENMSAILLQLVRFFQVADLTAKCEQGICFSHSQHWLRRGFSRF